MSTAITTDGLPRLVGYAELYAKYGWKKRALQRWDQKGRLPRPQQLPGGRVYWRLEQIKCFVDQQYSALSALAVSDPERLAPDQLGDAAVDLLTRAIEHEIGQQIDPRGICVTFGQPSEAVTLEQLQSAEAEALAIYRRQFADYEIARAWVMAAFLFPALRPTMAAGAATQALSRVFTDEKKLHELALAAMDGMMSDLEPQPAAMKAAAGRGYSTATDLADWLVRELKLPFREAHHVTGSIVKLAEGKSVALEQLSLADMQAVESRIGKAVFSVLSVESSVKSRTSHGGTAPQNVRKMARAWIKRLEKAAETR